jgi:hypothetical protein
LLTEQLADDDLIVASQRVTDHQKDHEIDFVVAIVGAGIICVEVKGGEVSHDGTDWRQRSRGGHVKVIDPVRQVRQARYALRGFVEADPCWTQGRVRWNHVVVLPNSDVSQGFALPECPRWMVIDRGEMGQIGEKLKAVALDQKTDLPLLADAAIGQLRTALSGRGLPQRDVVARASTRSGCSPRPDSGWPWSAIPTAWRPKQLAADLTDAQRFDSIVIDEAQDFADSWWEPMLIALRDPDAGGLYVFSDEGQRVFNRQGTPPVPLVPLILDQNIRNTRQIASAFQPLVDHPMRFLGGDGPEVRFVGCDTEEALGVGDDQVEVLLDEGWRPEDVALLTTGSRHPEQVARQAAGNQAYWDSFWDAEQVFYGHVLGFVTGVGGPDLARRLGID